MIVCIAPSFNWIGLIAPIVLFVSVLVAIVGVFSARSLARKRATLDMIEKFESTAHYKSLHAAFAYHRHHNSFEKLHNPTEQKDRADRQSVLDYLNHYEIVAVGIKDKILDKSSYDKWMRGPFVRDWNAASSFIQRERWKKDKKSGKWHYYDRLFEHFQGLACEWSPEAERISAKSSPPPSTAGGPGDEPIPADSHEDC